MQRLFLYKQVAYHIYKILNTNFDIFGRGETEFAQFGMARRILSHRNANTTLNSLSAWVRHASPIKCTMRIGIA